MPPWPIATTSSQPPLTGPARWRSRTSPHCESCCILASAGSPTAGLGSTSSPIWLRTLIYDKGLTREIELRDVEITVVADTAVLRCLVVDRVSTAPDETDTFAMPMTQTWVREGGRWRCLGGHAGPRLSDNVRDGVSAGCAESTQTPAAESM